MRNNMAECNCLDGAYESCDVCSPPLEKGWLARQMKQVTSDTKAVGGNWEPGSMIAHAHKQQSKIRKLQKQILENKKAAKLATTILKNHNFYSHSEAYKLLEGIYNDANKRKSNSR